MGLWSAVTNAPFGANAWRYDGHGLLLFLVCINQSDAIPSFSWLLGDDTCLSCSGESPAAVTTGYIARWFKCSVEVDNSEYNAAEP